MPLNEADTRVRLIDPKLPLPAEPTTKSPVSTTPTATRPRLQAATGHLQDKLAQGAAVNPPETFRLLFDQIADEHFAEMVDAFYRFYTEMSKDPQAKAQFFDWLFGQYRGTWWNKSRGCTRGKARSSGEATTGSETSAAVRDKTRRSNVGPRLGAMSSFNQRVFQPAGGTIPPDLPTYVTRPADRELFNSVRAGKFCNLAAAVQMGKSSLMVRALFRLRESGIATAFVDLDSIGTSGVTAEQWYFSLIYSLDRDLALNSDLETWWQNLLLSPAQRFVAYVQDVVLAQIERPIVVFIDSIGNTYYLDFSDRFFLELRTIYYNRRTFPAYRRIAFVLSGLTEPQTWVKDSSLPTYNIGHDIVLTNFGKREMKKTFLQALGHIPRDQVESVIDRVFYWTNGHPYLTQRVCAGVFESADIEPSREAVDDLVKEYFLSREWRRDSNLLWVHRLVETNPLRRELVRMYRQIRDGKSVSIDKSSPAQRELMLRGLVHIQGSRLQVNNEIYRRVFDRDWIRAILKS